MGSMVMSESAASATAMVAVTPGMHPPAFRPASRPDIQQGIDLQNHAEAVNDCVGGDQGWTH